MVRRTLPAVIALLLIALMLAACGTSRNSTRKCDGKKGQKTPMGLI